MEVLPTIDEIVDEIAEALESADYNEKAGVNLNDWLRAYKWPNWVELRFGTGQRINVVQREFGELDTERLVKWSRRTMEHMKTYTLPTLKEAVKVSLVRIFELEQEGIGGFVDTRPW
jgi:hypothetical protein